ncbi:hypothetical protein AR540_21700 [Pseudomonas sp. EpS/L25]|nr:hypothetical protein AR540_21700 [Pseudomonas sp. EpS/L25]
MIHHSVGVLRKFLLLLLNYLSANRLAATIPVLPSQVTDLRNKKIHTLVVIQIGGTTFIETNRTFNGALKANVLARTTKRLQIFAVIVGNSIIEKIEHRLNLVKVMGKPGTLYAL